MSKITEAVRTVIEPEVVDMGFELFDLQFVKEGGDHYLRVFIDNDEGVTLDDCVAVSERLSVVLDESDSDLIATAYFLEVSSPGAERPLKDERALQKAIGDWVHLNFYAQVDGIKEVEGRLLAYDDSTYTLETKDKARRVEKTYDRSNVSLIRLAIEF
ncbi:MAG: ribosome maturation factor RimP [Aerococcus sp.]|nr:ribosome maturation factor RimP [Aerococcus sp.]